MNIIQEILPANSKRRPGRKMKPRYITVHSTANPNATAKNHSNLLRNNHQWNPTTGWHVTVDDEQAIQHIPFDEVAYHAGDGAYGMGNSQSIGVEICEFTDSGRQAQAITNAVALVQTLMQRLGIDAANIVPHSHWTKKDCPRILLKDWDSFIRRVNGLYADVNQPNVWTGQVLRKGDKGLAVRDLQAMLKAALYDPGPIDGIFGEKTLQALLRAQKGLGLVVDGLAGPATLQALRIAASRSQPRTATFYIKSGPFGSEDDVDAVIAQLKAQYPGQEWSKVNATP